ncbi:hypothetical protein B4U84_22230 [Westiellopsis prolifica IICB1]|nr:hypothetical protein B4U84_22230 [Westiellopsis prolifica IICB1]
MQKTWIQQHKKTGIIGGVILVSATTLTFLGHLGVMAQICEFVGLNCPGKDIFNPPLPKTQWIGVRIEHVSDKELPGQNSETTLVQTDRSANDLTAVLKNTDERAFHKYNSGNYRVALQRSLERKEKLCLKISGERVPRQSEFMNIIQINKFPNKENYDGLAPERRDKLCEEDAKGTHQVIVAPME